MKRIVLRIEKREKEREKKKVEVAKEKQNCSTIHVRLTANEWLGLITLYPSAKIRTHVSHLLN